MMRYYGPFLALLLAICIPARAELDMMWCYHDDNDGTDDRTMEYVPGQGFPFIGNGSTTIPNADAVTLYVLTANQFAGDADEQVFIRWWNGRDENWIMGTWEANVFLGTGENDAGRFHGLPDDAPVMLDLWKFEIPADKTLPGDNYYVIQMKGWTEEGVEENYLLNDTSEDSRNNNLNQSWTSGDYFDHDWKVFITD